MAIVKTLSQASARDWGHLYQGNFEIIKNAAWRITRCETTAEDIAQETFLYLMAANREFQTELDFVRYAKWKSRNLAISRLSSKDRTIAMGLEDSFWDGQTSTAPEPSELIENAETEALVRMALTQVSERHRLALVSTYFQGSSIEELARQLDVDANASRQLLHRARKSFLAALSTIAKSRGSTVAGLLGATSIFLVLPLWFSAGMPPTTTNDALVSAITVPTLTPENARSAKVGALGAPNLDANGVELRQIEESTPPYSLVQEAESPNSGSNNMASSSDLGNQASLGAGFAESRQTSWVIENEESIESLFLAEGAKTEFAALVSSGLAPQGTTQVQQVGASALYSLDHGRYKVGALVSAESDSPVQFLWLEVQLEDESIVFWPTDLGSVLNESDDELNISIAATSFIAAGNENGSATVPLEDSSNFVLNGSIRGSLSAPVLKLSITERW